MKKVLSVCLSVIMAVSAVFCVNFTAFADTLKEFEYQLIDSSVSDTDVIIKKYNGTDTDVVVPAFIDGYSVKTVDFHTFENNDTVENVVISEGITAIEDSAFSNCSSLKTISIPASVTFIDSCSPIYDCPALEQITVNSDNADYMDIDGVLFSKDGTQILIYPAGRPEAVYNVPSGVIIIGESAFGRAVNLTEINLPSGLQIIGDSAFSLCENIASIIIPTTVTTIESYAFNSCKSLKEITVPDSVTTLGDSAFSVCKALTSITLSANIKTIESQTFALCSALRKIEIPSGVTTIGEHAFVSCYGLSELTVDKSVVNIMSGAFANCKINDVYYNGTMQDWKAIDFNKSNEALDDALIHCNDGDIVPPCKHPYDSTYVQVNRVEPTCTTDGGVSQVTYCGICGEEIGGCGEFLSKTGHKWNNGKVTKPATVSANGTMTYSCVNNSCNETRTSAIAKISTVKISATSYTYDGKVKTPALTVKDANGKALVKGTDYTVSYSSGRKAVGKYAVKITFKGKYSGTKTFNFTIKPKGTSVASVSPASKAFTVKWKKQAVQTTGYQIQYATNSSFKSAKTVTVAKNGTVSRKITKLSGKKRYYVRVRTYKKVGSANYYSSWSPAKSVTTKK